VSQTKRAAQSKSRKSNAKTISRKALHYLVWSMPMTAAAEQLGLSSNGLAKICDRMLIPYPTRGHWAKQPAEQEPPAPLPAAPDLDQDVVIADRRASSRRERTRLAPEARREQILDTAMKLVVAEGIAAASMKRVAREIGISETLAFTYFSSRAVMLAELARRELGEMERIRRARAAGAESRRSQVALSTSAYLEQIEARGSVLHALLAAPEVRALLRPERRSSKERGAALTASNLTARYGVAPDFARGATRALTAASRRAGHMLAMKRLSRPAAERLVMAIIDRANRDLVDEAAASGGAGPRRGGRAKR
jgi:AcrR family transcriptional regulator